MSAVSVVERSDPSDPLEPTWSPTPAARTIRVGLLGLGQVGQAVARLSASSRLNRAGCRLQIAGALVRDVDKPRRCLKPSRLTTNPSAFLRGKYDVVIEALGTVEPARSLVSRLLGRGVPVVTANKALVAAHGPSLAAIATKSGTTLRYEASALAAVPFLGALGARPLVSDVQRLAAVVNGTSNFILSTLDRTGRTFESALDDARALGLVEPDPSRDIDGLDAADKLALLAAIFGWGALPLARLEVTGIRHITGGDLAAARRLDAAIKPVVWAAHTTAGVRAFVGPALVESRHPLASVNGTLSGIQLSGRYVSDLFFAGPGAGPDVTAATILDDVVEAVSSVPIRARTMAAPARVATLAAAPETGWFLRASFPGVVPDASALTRLLAAHDAHADWVSDAHDNTRWLRLRPAHKPVVDRAVSALSGTHRIQCLAIRTLEGVTQ